MPWCQRHQGICSHMFDPLNTHNHNYLWIFIVKIYYNWLISVLLLSDRLQYILFGPVKWTSYRPCKNLMAWHFVGNVIYFFALNIIFLCERCNKFSILVLFCSICVVSKYWWIMEILFSIKDKLQTLLLQSQMCGLVANCLFLRLCKEVVKQSRLHLVVNDTTGWVVYKLGQGCP